MPRMSLSAMIVSMVLGSATPASAQWATMARETAEFLLRTFTREAAGESLESLARQVERLAVHHGDDAIMAVRKVGPTTFRLVEEAGVHGPAAIKLMARHGDQAVWIVSRPKALALFVRHGDDAATALIRHRTIAESLIGRFDEPALRALRAVSDPRAARRLQMLADEGVLGSSGQTREVFGIVGRHGDRAVDFLWKHRRILAGTAVMAAFLANPEPYLQGAVDLTEALGSVAVQPLAEGAREAARGINWNVLAIAGMFFLSLAWWLRARRTTRITSHRVARRILESPGTSKDFDGVDDADRT